MGYKFDTVRLGVAKRGASNLVKCVATNPLSEGEVSLTENFGEVDLFSSLGITAMPADVSDDGAAEGFIVRDVAGTNGIVVAARDERTASVTAELKPGETCVHSTGSEFDSRLFLKKESASLVVGNKSSLTLKSDALRVAVGGATVSVDGDAVTITAAGGQSFITMTSDTIWLSASVVMLGAKAAVPVSIGTSPAVVVSPSVLVPPPTP